MNARRKAKKYKRMYEGLLNSQPKVTIMPMHTQEFGASRLLTSLEYELLDKESIKALLASEFIEIIKDNITYTVTETNEFWRRNYRVEARLKICK
jgi:hypothetical protein